MAEGIDIWLDERSLIMSSGERPNVKDKCLFSLIDALSPVVISILGASLYAYTTWKLLSHSRLNKPALNGNAKLSEPDKICCPVSVE